MTRPAGLQCLLVNFEGADWDSLHRLVDAGSLPHLDSLITRGCLGTLQAPTPLISPMLWNTMVTGQPASRHGIAAVTNQHGLFTSPLDRQCPTIWEIAQASSLDSSVVGGWATHGMIEGDSRIVSEFFGSPKFTSSPERLAQALCPSSLSEQLGEAWIRPDEIDSDTIEWFIPNWREVDQEVDPRLALLADALALTLSRHNAAIALLEEDTMAFSLVNYPLLDLLGHTFQPCSAQLEGVSQQDIERYGEVMDKGWVLQDMLLGRLLETIGPDTSVMLTSAWGLNSSREGMTAKGWLRGGPESHRRSAGWILTGGSTLHEDALLQGANIYDVVPTLLALLGLPGASNMQGRVLAEAFRIGPQKTLIADWQEIVQPPAANSDAAVELEREQLLQHFQRLGQAPGNTEAPDKNPGRPEDWHWNMARAYIQNSEHLGALPLLEELAQQHPENILYMVELIECQLHLGLVQEAREWIQDILDSAPESALAYLAIARIEQAAGRYQESLKYLEQARAAGQSGSLLQSLFGLSYMRLARWSEALDAFEAALANAPNNPKALLGRCRALLGLRRFGEVVSAALDLIEQNYQNPLAHYLLALALLNEGRTREAIVSFSACAALAPRWKAPQQYLLRIKREIGAPKQELEPHRLALAATEPQSHDVTKIRSDAAQRETDRLEERRRLRQQQQPDLRNSIPSRHGRTPDRALNLTLVTSLPGGGAAAVMKMLGAGDFDLLLNDSGGYDWPRLQDLPIDPRVLDAAEDKILYMPSALLAYLPRLHHYKIVFVDRDIDKIADAQQRQLAGTAPPAVHQRDLNTLLNKHRNGALSAARLSPNVDLLRVEFNALLDNPEVEARRICEFLDHRQLPQSSTMSAAIR